MKVAYIDLGKQHQAIHDELIKKCSEVITSGQYILGKYVKEFEENFANYCGVKYAVGVANGTDALVLSMKALGIGKGDEVITAPNSYLASASSIALCGATPVFADVNSDFNINPKEVEKKITNKTKAIMPVHLTGRAARMKEILEIAECYDLFVIEDAAQAVGASYYGEKVGSLGTTACFSLHPLKNLNAIGDAGMITTNDKNIYDELLKLRNHGLKNRDECVKWSLNSRLDALQAAMLNLKLNYIDQANDLRRQYAQLYHEALHEIVETPHDESWEKSVYHTFIIQTAKRNELQQYLSGQGIETKVHYPIPIHLQKAAMELGYKEGDFPVTEKQANSILSLPVHTELSMQQLQYVIDKIQEFHKKDK